MLIVKIAEDCVCQDLMCYDVFYRNTNLQIFVAKTTKAPSHPVSTCLQIRQELLLNTVPKERVLTKQLPFGFAGNNVRGKECLRGSYISN